MVNGGLREIHFSIWSFVPYLCVGMTFANFHSSGTVLWSFMLTLHSWSMPELLGGSVALDKVDKLGIRSRFNASYHHTKILNKVTLPH